MGSRSSGRRPRSTHIRALEGVAETRLNRDEPIPGDGLIIPPVELSADAQAVWNRLAPDLTRKGCSDTGTSIFVRGILSQRGLVQPRCGGGGV